MFPQRQRRPIWSPLTPQDKLVTQGSTNPDSGIPVPVITQQRRGSRFSNRSQGSSEAHFQTPVRGQNITPSCSSEEFHSQSQGRNKFRTIFEIPEEETIKPPKNGHQILNCYTDQIMAFKSPQTQKTPPPRSTSQLSNMSSPSVNHEELNQFSVQNQDCRRQQFVSNISKQDMVEFVGHVEYLTSGVEVVKYGRRDRFFASERFLQITPDLKHIILSGDTILKMIPLNQILQIQMGRETENFKRFTTSSIKGQKSFSFLMKERTLDLEMKSAQELDKFIHSVSYILKMILKKQFVGVTFPEL